MLMFLGGDSYVRRDKLVAGDPVIAPGQQPDTAKVRVNNGVIGDPRPATPEFGKLFLDIQVRNAVAQIRSLIAATPSVAR
jgi:creatinine amidohydrolase/Fe(II)-dependent formamide hydrolase-like protein